MGDGALYLDLFEQLPMAACPPRQDENRPPRVWDLGQLRYFQSSLSQNEFSETC
jgi:hypothetical protein